MLKRHEFGVIQRLGAVMLLFVIVFAANSCGGSSQTSVSDRTPAISGTEAPSNTVWLCKPGLANNPCESDMTTAVISADGSQKIETASPAENPPIDCFYVYPTVSGQSTANATLDIEPAETNIAISQASRFSQVCKVYAPMYRQMTVAAITGAIPRTSGEAQDTREIAYADVLSAWQDYLAHYNNGRGVVLIGHSQGTMMLTRLITAEIDPNPDVRKLLVSAIMLGGNVLVRQGQDIGGDFQNIPACHSTDQTGCVVAYSSFNQTPPDNTFFGKPSGPGASIGRDTTGLEVLCVNPASLSGGTGALLPYDRVPASTAATAPWVSYPGEYTAHCQSANGANWLQIDTTNVPGDTRPVVSPVLGPTWGLHLEDVNIAFGNLVDLVRQQVAAYTK